MIRRLLARFRTPAPKPITMSFPFARRTVVFLGRRELEQMMLRDVLLFAARSGISTAGWERQVGWEGMIRYPAAPDDTLTLFIHLVPPGA